MNAQRQDGSTRPVIISEAAARTFFADRDPIGRTLVRAQLLTRIKID